MDEVIKPIFESNGLLDFFPTPPESTEDVDVLPPRTSNSMPKRPDRFEYEDEAPPPDFDEEPSDFEDEMNEIMEREKQSSSRQVHGKDLDYDMDDVRPVASCESI